MLFELAGQLGNRANHGDAAVDHQLFFLGVRGRHEGNETEDKSAKVTQGGGHGDCL